MRNTILAIWSALADGEQSTEAQINKIVTDDGSTARLLGAIDALSDGETQVAANLFREYADQLEADLTNKEEA